MTKTINEVTPETIAYLESLFDENHPCEFRTDGNGVGGGKDTPKCDLPATWVWVFEMSCKCPTVKGQYYVCATHHLICQQANAHNLPWPCHHCMAGATVKEIRRIK